MIQSPQASADITLVLPVYLLRQFAGAVRPSDRLQTDKPHFVL
ncbi:hypothetical protein N8783_01975 [Alphaproteobacteria bacterium]|nr:hypothetical protein [Alphaproteobacteria bacterium]